MHAMTRGSLVLGCALALSLSSSAYAQGCGSKAKADVVDTAIKAGSFKTLVAAVKAAGLVGVLKGDGPFTVFAPTDAAFAKLPATNGVIHVIDSVLLPEAGVSERVSPADSRKYF